MGMDKSYYVTAFCPAGGIWMCFSMGYASQLLSTLHAAAVLLPEWANVGAQYIYPWCQTSKSVVVCK